MISKFTKKLPTIFFLLQFDITNINMWVEDTSVTVIYAFKPSKFGYKIIIGNASLEQTSQIEDLDVSSNIMQK